MRRHADRLATAGYLTVAVDLFSAGGATRCLVGTFRALLSGRGRAYADIESGRQWLLAQPDCTGTVGTIGFCMGGGFALMTASSGFDAASVNYGQVPTDLDAVARGACPVVGSYGGSDRGLNGAAAKVEAALTRAGVPHDVKEYPGAGHSFLNDAPNGPRVLRP
nr:dienelactone hydrolase family protein [Nocardioidaceae bacterium]